MIEVLTRFMRILSKNVMQKENLKHFVEPFLVRFSLEQYKTKHDFDTKLRKIEKLYREKVKFMKRGYSNDGDEIIEVLKGA